MKKLLILLIALFFTMNAVFADNQPMELDLSQAIKICMENNLSLQQSLKTVNEAQARLLQAKSPLYPNLAAGYSYTRTDPVPTFNLSSMGVPGPNIPVMPNDNYNTSLTLSQLIYSFGKVDNSVVIAGKSIDLARLNVQGIKNGLTFQVKQAFYKLLLAQKVAEIAAEKLKSVQDHLRVAEDKFTEGTVPEFDVVKSRSSLAESQEEKIKADNTVQLAANNLKNLLLLNLDTQVVPVYKDLNPPKVASEQECREIASTSRPELLMAELQVKIAQDNYKMQKAQHNPDVSVNASYNWTRASIMGQPRSSTVMANFALPLYNGGLTNAKVNEAIETLQKSKLLQEQVLQNVTLEIRQAVLNIQNAEARFGSADQGVKEAKNALEIAEVRYQEGMGTIIELNNAELSMRSAQLVLSNAVYEQFLAIADLERARGKEFQEAKP